MLPQSEFYIPDDFFATVAKFHGRQVEDLTNSSKKFC